MQLNNQTDSHALLFRTVIDDTRLAAAVIARVTYRIEGRRLVVDEQQPWITSPIPWDGPEGPMPADEEFYRGGVDLFVFGKVYGPGGRPCAATQLVVRCTGGFEYRMDAIGNRVWQKQRRGFVPSPAEPFESLPLSLSRAYGGKVPWDGIEVAFPDNPDGRGYCFAEDQVEGTPLPNFEAPGQRIRQWNDTPEPVGVGFCPPSFGPKLRRAARFNDKGTLVKLNPTFFNSAFPDLVVPEVNPGDTISVEGVLPGKTLVFVTPAIPFLVELQLGQVRARRIPKIDQLGIQAETGRVFITYRFAFRYEMRPRERRSCVLTAAEPAAV